MSATPGMFRLFWALMLAAMAGPAAYAGMVLVVMQLRYSTTSDAGRVYAVIFLSMLTAIGVATGFSFTALVLAGLRGVRHRWAPALFTCVAVSAVWWVSDPVMSLAKSIFAATFALWGCVVMTWWLARRASQV